MPLTVRRRFPTLLAASVAALVALAAGSLVLALPLRDAQAQPPPGPPPALAVNADVKVLLAGQVEGRGSIDPAIGNLPQLRKPPLSAFNSFHLLDKRILSLPMGRTGAYTLPNGRVLQLTFVEPAPDGFRVLAAITRPGGNAYLKQLNLTARPNETVFVAGQSFRGGTLVLAITLRP
jgi:hypothetical protein